MHARTDSRTPSRTPESGFLRFLACARGWVLGWMVLSVLVATLSPLVKPQAMNLVCSTAGLIQLVVTGDDGNTQPMGSHGMDCALCLPMVAPPPLAYSLPQPLQPLGYALQTIPAAHIAALTAAPPPGRGPPAFS